MHRIESPAVADATDARLAWEAQQGEMASLGELFQKYRPPLYAAAAGILGFKSEAEDAVQDTMLIAFTRLHTLRDPGAIGGWLHAILRNHCCMELRRRRPQVTPEEAERTFRNLSDDGCVGQQIARQEMRTWVWTALRQLPADQRLAVLLRYFGSYASYAEIAAILGVPIGTVRSRLAEAKRKLGGLLLSEAADAGNRAETADRESFYRSSFKGLYCGERDAFLRTFSRDLQLIFRGVTRTGRRFLEVEVDADLSTGVKVHPERILTSGDLTVLEGRFENPAEDPFHCPPGILMALLHRGDQVVRLHLHLAPRTPARA